jgi:hypothetical protein
METVAFNDDGVGGGGGMEFRGIATHDESAVCTRRSVESTVKYFRVKR